MNITTISNPVYANAAGTIINLTLDTVEYGVIEYSANSTDSVALGRDLYARALAGEFGAVVAFTAEPRFATVAGALAAIDVAAGTARARYITDAPGQEGTYLSKASDAAGYKAAGYPAASVADYPYVHAEAKAVYGDTPTAAEIQAAADNVLAIAAAWKVKGSQIEQARIKGKRAVAAAADAAAITAAADAAIAELDAL